ncbi:MAG: NAD-dependent epimerase/dehydratase family protein [Planctomycetota bacterium]|jgi:UDP-glucose 4-epimerase
MRVLVIGGAGFIGRYCVERLMEDGHIVTVFDPAPLLLPEPHRAVAGDVLDAPSVLCYVMQSDAVLHLAGLLGTSETIDRPIASVHVNIIGALNVFEAIRVDEVRGCTITVGNHFMANTYAISKSAAERFALMYNIEHGTQIAVVRGLNAYGPRQKAAPIRKVIPNFVLPALRDEPLIVYGDGEQIMDFIYVTDLARLLVEATIAPHGIYSSIYEAGSGRATTIKEVAETVIRLAESKSTIEYRPMRAGEMPRSTVLADTDTLGPLHIDPSTFVSLEDGLRETIAWFRAAMTRMAAPVEDNDE